VSQAQLSRILKSLQPRNANELSILRFVLNCAEQIRDAKAVDRRKDLHTFIQQIPDETRRYFHSLVEAMEIYQSIRGPTLPLQTLSLSDYTFVAELKQIRDMCLEEGLRSIY
jgi:hypothetical protein